MLALDTSEGYTHYASLDYDLMVQVMPYNRGGKGVDANSVTVKVNNNTVYSGNTANYTSAVVIGM